MTLDIRWEFAALSLPMNVSGLFTLALPPPRIRPVAENAERIAMIVDGIKDLRAAMPMLEVDLRNAAIIDALDQRGQVTLTASRDGRLEIS
jgi:hypothetical protein